MDNSSLTFIFNSLYGTGEFETSLTDYCFLIIPGREGPKWVIPLEPTYGLTTLKQWRPYSLKAYIKWQLILYAYQWKILKYFPKIEIISFSNINVESSLCSIQNVVPIIYIGTKNSTQKAVVQLVKDDESSPYAVLKLPLGTKADQQIKQESSVLSLLPDSLQAIAPTLLDSSIALQSWMAGKASSRELSPLHIDVLLKLRSESVVYFSSFIECLNCSLDSLSSEAKASLPIVDELFEHIELLDSSFKYTAVWIHGDFAPWNIKVNNGLVLIDWEDGHANGLPLQDLLHFYLIQAYLFGKKENCLVDFFKNQYVDNYLNSLNLSPVKANHLTRYYLIKTCCEQLKAENLDHATYLHSLLVGYKCL